MTGRTIVIGDVHGCLDELRELILEVVDVSDKDRVIFLGDLIDRGPDPAGVVAFVKGLGAECVMGNHEEKALRWRRHEMRRIEDPKHYKNPMRDIHQDRLTQWAKIPADHWDWIAKWPKFIHINNLWTAVHAGLMPGVEPELQVPNELMRLRYVRCAKDVHGYEKYKMSPLGDTGEPSDPKDGERVVHWTKLWSGPRNIVYGHYVWDKVQHTKHAETGAMTFGIDTGCVHGGYLTALVSCKDHLYTAQVKAQETYARKLWAEE